LDSFIHGPQDLSQFHNSRNFKDLKGDIRDISLVSNLIRTHDSSVLLAALVGEAACDRDPTETVDINYLGSLNFLAAARYYQKRFIFTSTDSCYGTREGELLDESSALRPISLYAELKARTEEEVLAPKPQNNFCPVVLRLATVYGQAPRMRFDLAVNLLTREATLKGRAKIFSGEQWRPLVHVSDVARAFRLVLEAPPEKISGQVFNVGSNHQNLQFKDLGHIIEREIPGTIIETVPQPPDLRDYHVNFEKIQKILGFQAEVEVASGIKEIRDSLLRGIPADPYSPTYRNIS
jgi:nucleoside-diphosphate-sugar epimerase